MATIGHTLVGLTATTLSGRDARRWPSLAWWPGVLVLGAHALDVGEWLMTLAGVPVEHSHMLHHWPGATGCVLVGVLLLRLLGRVRTLGPHVCCALAVYSHLLLDVYGVRHGISALYRQPGLEQGAAASSLDVWSEVWFYGFVLLVGLLASAVLRPQRSRLVWQAAILMMPVTAIAFCVHWMLPQTPAVWVLPYAGIGVFGLWAGRFLPLRGRWLWNVVPALPVLALGAVELWAGLAEREGRQRVARGEYAGAAACFRRSLELPTRSDMCVRWWRLALAYEGLHDLPAAEKAYRASADADLEWHWGKLNLADFYVRWPGTPYYQPQAAERLWHEVAEGDEPAYARNAALARLRNLRGVRPP
jgi:hypothetical protein